MKDGYDRPHLQAPSIYIPYKDAVTCRNRAGTGPLPIAAGRFWYDSIRYGIFISATEEAEPRNVAFVGGLLKVGVY